MSTHRWSASWHRVVARIVSVLGGLVAALVFLDFGLDSGRGGDSTDTNAMLVIAITTVASIAILSLTARRFDQVHAPSSFGRAVLRLLPFVGVLLIAAPWLMNQGIFAGGDLAFLGTLLVCAIAVFLVWVCLPTGHSSLTQPTHAAEQDSALPAKRRSWVHRVTSGFITAVWVPLGFLVWFGANWCPDEGTGDAVFATSTAFVIVQLLGNASAGWALDRRYGDEGGVALAIGRSLVVAMLLAVVVGFALSLFVPDGPSNYCG